jgi:hypothetical protein
MKKYKVYGGDLYLGKPHEIEGYIEEKMLKPFFVRNARKPTVNDGLLVMAEKFYYFVNPEEYGFIKVKVNKK